jgi:hypothetical protein
MSRKDGADQHVSYFCPSGSSSSAHGVISYYREVTVNVPVFSAIFFVPTVFDMVVSRSLN